MSPSPPRLRVWGAKMVSVIIPTYNRRGFVLEAVGSVLNQTHRELELVVVDDGSSDGTAGYLSDEVKDDRFRLVAQENLGVSSARNRGVAETSGEWLAFLDSDDYWLEEKLEVQLAETLAVDGCHASYTEEIWYRRGRRVNPRNVHSKYSGEIFDKCLKLCIISPSSIMMRRELYEALGGFDETMPACEDYDLWLRLSAANEVHLVKTPLIVKRNGHEGQLSQAHWGLDRFRIRALWKLLYGGGLSTEQQRQALEILSAKAKVVGEGALKRGNVKRGEVFTRSMEEAARWLEKLQLQG